MFDLSEQLTGTADWLQESASDLGNAGYDALAWTGRALDPRNMATVPVAIFDAGRATGEAGVEVAETAVETTTDAVSSAFGDKLVSAAKWVGGGLAAGALAAVGGLAIRRWWG
ncbi:MAG: hypothetical protein CMD39_07455 [Gammaproteobacteria bacterium]|nr:hypothetical protein [Gammaproteobacteria bacterium]